MPSVLNLSDEIFVWRMVGKITKDDFLKSHSQLTGDPRFPAIRYALIDFSGVTESELDANSLQIVSIRDSYLTEVNSNLQFAIVTPTPESRGFARMWQLFGMDNGWTSTMFNDEAEALQWLDSKKQDADREEDPMEPRSPNQH